jgi:tRNA(His) 5'-end guanylyltransferase
MWHGGLAMEHGAEAVHVVSDEINLLFLRHVPYGGRTFKIISVLAAHASAELTAKLGRPLHFDGRVVKLRDACDAASYVLFRARVGLNNYVIQLARAWAYPRPHAEDRGVATEGGDQRLRTGVGDVHGQGG